MISQEIRRKFLGYFKNHDHSVIPSSPVVPHEDPTLLFTNAGMVQFKDVFLGKSVRDYKKAATSQKCVRVGGKHNDLDNVGHTTRHLTFFEMLGNFSFGDYFKEQAIQYAWEVSTEIYGFSPQDLWITVFEDDDEAFSLWEKYMPASRIVRMGEKDNFWTMGETGPCGPCSELYFDRGNRWGHGTSPKDDPEGERYLEFWNLVFMQYNRDGSGKLSSLPKQSIDTGSGLERVVSLKMGVNSLFEIDIFQHLIAHIEKVVRKKYEKEDLKMAPAFHVIADHIRTLSFAIADGAQPGNVDRGYVLRKILRRAVRYGRMLGMEKPFLAQVLPGLTAIMGDDYPELKTAHLRIEEILTLEEESFIRTLKRGGNILNSIIETAQKNPLKQITGEEAFKLKDTYGFPLEEIVLLAKDASLKVNIDAYELLEHQARERSRSAKTSSALEAGENLFAEYVQKHGTCTFTGYTDTAGQGTIMALLSEGRFTESIKEGQTGTILLNKTPFYAEKGGQIADIGIISHHQAYFRVTSCQNPYPGVIVHHGVVEKGVFIPGEPVEAVVDLERRQNIANHHTATHLLHWALVQVLGPHIRQAGSLVEADRLRFDFNHHKAVSPLEIRQIEDLVNAKVREDKPVHSYELSYEEAQKQSDIKQFFGEKYGSSVRVVDAGSAKELCGGTHTHSLGTIGLFRIVKESGIAAGVRRIEAVTGKAAEAWMHEEQDTLLQLISLFKTQPEQLIQKAKDLLEENRLLDHELKLFKRKQLKVQALELLQNREMVKAIPLLCVSLHNEADEIPLLIDELSALLQSGVLIAAALFPDRCQLSIRVSSDLVKKGMDASALIKTLAPIIGGMGGGKKESASAGGKHPDKVPELFEKARRCLEEMS